MGFGDIAGAVGGFLGGGALDAMGILPGGTMIGAYGAGKNLGTNPVDAAKGMVEWAKENIVAYYINVASGDIGGAFGLTADETGYIGINEYADKDTARVIDLVMSGVTFFPERVDGIVVGTIAGA